MKVLVVSLLRLGDALLSVPTLNGLRRKYPEAEIDLLINTEAKNVIHLLQVNKAYVFPRADLQASLGDAQRPIFEALDVIKGLADELSARKYNLIVNVTHTRISGYMCGMITAKEKIGLSLDRFELPQFGNSWFKYLNDMPIEPGRPMFHFADIFYLGSGLERGKQKFDFASADPVSANDKSETFRIALQPMTSDPKKNWRESQWLEMFRYLKTLGTGDFEVAVLGAPSEQDAVDRLVVALKSQHISAQVAICDLNGVKAILDSSDLLITGDTSIKHLACATKVKIVEIALGSSVIFQTGAYKEDSLIIMADVPCGPCPHTSPCTQSTHVCAQAISADFVASAVHHFIAGDWTTLHRLVDEVEKESEDHIGLAMYRTSQLPNGFWFPERIGSRHTEGNIDRSSELCAWRTVLDKEHLQAVGGTGTEGLMLSQFWLRRLGSGVRGHLQLIADGIETKTMQYEDDLNGRLSAIAQKKADSTFLNLRSVQMKLNEAFNQQGEKKRVLRSFRNELRERNHDVE